MMTRMAGAVASKERVTREAYLAMQGATDEKLWLWDGEVFAPQGASIDHERIVANIVGTLRNVLGEGPCEALPSAVRVKIPGGDRYVYPDALVACAPLLLEGERKDTLLNPSIVFEVLSPSTEAFDRGDKAEGFRAIASLSGYVVVAQVRRHVEVLTRASDGTWTLREIGPTGALELTLAGRSLTLPLDEIYRRVEL